MKIFVSIFKKLWERGKKRYPENLSRRSQNLPYIKRSCRFLTCSPGPRIDKILMPEHFAQNAVFSQWEQKP